MNQNNFQSTELKQTKNFFFQPKMRREIKQTVFVYIRKHNTNTNVCLVR